MLAGSQGSTWAVEGGNKLVCSGLLKLTKANIIAARVTGVSLHSSGEPGHRVCSGCHRPGHGSGGSREGEVGSSSMGMTGHREGIGRLENILVLVKHLGEGPGVCPSPPLVCTSTDLGPEVPLSPS